MSPIGFLANRLIDLDFKTRLAPASEMSVVFEK